MTPLERKIRVAVKKHYASLNKIHVWDFRTHDLVHDYRDMRGKSFDKSGDFVAFDLHRGGLGESTYRWVDEADKLFPVLKKLTGASFITVGVLGDLSGVGGIHVTCGGIPRKKK